MKRPVSIAALFVCFNEVPAAHAFFVSPAQRIHHRIHHHHSVVTPKTHPSNRSSSRDETSTAAAAAGALDLSARGGDVDGTRRSPSGIFTQNAEDAYSNLIRTGLAGRDEDATRSTGDLLLGIEDIRRGWVELDELVVDGEILPDELEQLYRKSLGSSDGDKLDMKGFFTLYQSIDELFEPDDRGEDDDDRPYHDDKDTGVQTVVPQGEPSLSSNTEVPIVSNKTTKEKLVSYLKEMYTDSSDDLPEKLACGFDCTDKERKDIHHLIELLETNGPSDLVSSRGGKIDESQLMGEWDLRYTSSHAMLINKSLSGLGRSTSDQARFEGLRKRLGGTKYLGKIDYVETFGGKEASFDVVVAGEWFLEERKHAFTGRPSQALRVDPETLTYGLSKNQASEWSSLGPIKLLDILYLDEDLMILRGNVNLKSFFIYQRIRETVL